MKLNKITQPQLDALEKERDDLKLSLQKEQENSVSLKTQLEAALVNADEGLKKENEELKNSLENKTIEFDNALKSKDEDIEELKTEIKGLEDVIDDQSEALQKLQTSAGSSAKGNNADLPVLKVDDKKVKFLKPKFRLNGDPTLYTVEQASADPDLIRKILAIPGQHIVKVLV